MLIFHTASPKVTFLYMVTQHSKTSPAQPFASHLNRAVRGSRQVVAPWNLFPKGGGKAGGSSLLEFSDHTTPLPGMYLITTETDEPKPWLDRGQDRHLGWAETAQESMCWLPVTAPKTVEINNRRGRKVNFGFGVLICDPWTLSPWATHQGKDVW